MYSMQVQHGPVERRKSPRETIRLPMRWAHLPGACTRDISAEGLFVLVPSYARVDMEWVSVDIRLPWAQLRFRALGEVLRIEPGPMECGLALRLHAPRLESLREADGCGYSATDLSSPWRLAKA